MLIRKLCASVFYMAILWVECSGEADAQTFTTPAEFVAAVKQLSLHDNLADYLYTARALKLELSADPEISVRNPADDMPLGHAVSVHLDAVPPQFSKDNFWYYIFHSVDGRVRRTRFIVNMNRANLCVRRGDVEAQFGRPEKRQSDPHSDTDGFSYRSLDTLNIYFEFSLNQECLIFISSFQEFFKE